MEAFYISIIFLGILLVVGSIFFILMDRVNGKDFFKEFDRKKDEMFNLIQDSEEMVDELNRMSDYVVTVISEKNQEFLTRNKSLNKTVQAAEDPQNISVSEPMPQPEAKPVTPPENKPVQVPVYIPIAIHSEESEELKDPIIEEKQVNTQISNNIFDKNKEDFSGKSRLILNDKRREVMKLIEQGLSNDEIAAKMKMGKGEIGLIRGLSK